MAGRRRKSLPITITITNHSAVFQPGTVYSCGREMNEEGRSSYDFGHVGSMLMDIDMNEIVPVQNWGAANE